MKSLLYSAYSDGTHTHFKYDGTETYCTQKHPKKLSTPVKIAIISGWFTAFILLTHLILKSNGY
jgi:hypothetical protein